MGLNRTPIISQQRLNCATFYTFPSAMEDIGLNINERNNKVSLSHYVILNLPNIQLEHADGSMDELNSNLIRLWKIVSNESRGTLAASSVDVNSWLPAVLQNYAMNFETNIRNQSSYDFSSPKTVTERIFWKMLQKLGALHLNRDDNGYYYETASDVTKHTIKGFGYITSSSQSSKAHTIDTETYIMIPSSYGQMKYLMKEASDNNYVIGKSYASTNPDGVKNHLEGHVNEDEYIRGFRESFYDDYLNQLYVVDKRYITDPAYNEGDHVNDALEMDFNLSDLKTTIAGGENISYDDLAINPLYRQAAQYEFNAILVYYTISDSVGNDVATNLYGIIILDSAQHDGKTIVGDIDPGASTTPMVINSYTKTSGNEAQFGSSYSIRLDIQTASIYDNTSNIITDISTAESSTLTDFNEVISNLSDCLKIMKSNAVAVSNMNRVVQSVKQLTADTSESVKQLEQSVNDILHGNVRDISANDVNTTSLHVGELIFNAEDITETVDGVETSIGYKDSPISIYSYDGETQYGELDGSVFKYKNISTERLDASTSVTDIHGVPSTGISFNQLDSDGNVTEKQIMSLTENGTLAVEDAKIDYNITSQKQAITDSDKTAIEAIWSDINVQKSADKLSLYMSNIPNKYISVDNTDISIKTIIPMLIWKIKELEAQVAARQN